MSMQHPTNYQKYAINPKAFMGYLKRGNATSFHPYGHDTTRNHDFSKGST